MPKPMRSPTTGAGRRRRRPAQVGVLVVQRGDLPARRHGVRAQRAARQPARSAIGISMSNDTSRLAIVEDREAGLRAGLHQRPDLERGAQALALRTTEARFDRLQQALVVAVVVRDVAARAQEPAHRPLSARRQRAARRGRRCAEPPAVSSTSSVSNRPCAIARRATASTRSISAAAYGGIGAGVAVRAAALRSTRCRPASPPCSHAARARERGASSCVRQPVRPPGTPISISTSKLALRRMRALPRLRSAASCAGESTRNTTRRSACWRSSCWMASRSASPTNWLAISARRTPAARRRASCVHGGEGDAPGAGVELAGEELRRHRRLAVRREVDAPAAAPAAASRPGCASTRRASTAPAATAGPRPARSSPAPTHFAAAQRRLAERKALEAGVRERVEQVEVSSWRATAQEVPRGCRPKSGRAPLRRSGGTVCRAGRDGVRAAGAEDAARRRVDRARDVALRAAMAARLDRRDRASGWPPAAPACRGAAGARTASAVRRDLHRRGRGTCTTTRSEMYSTTARSCEMKSMVSAEALAAGRAAG